MQTQRSIRNLDISESPRIRNRHLNNWEATRLYAGNDASGTGGLNGENGTIFNFAATGPSAARNLPVILDRYIVVARAMASVGINGFEINLVNADNVYLTPAYIAQEAALADALRPYGIKISLAINYTAPTDSRFAPDTLTNEQLDPYERRVPGLVDAEGPAAAGVDPGLHGLHRQGQLRRPAGTAGLRLRPRRRRQRHRGGGGASGDDGLLAHLRLQRRRRQRQAEAAPTWSSGRSTTSPRRTGRRGASRTTCSCRPRTARWTSRPASRSTRCSAAWRTPTRRSSCRSPRSTPGTTRCSRTWRRCGRRP